MILKLLEADIQSFKAFLNRNRKLINWLRLVVYAVHTYLLFLMHSLPNRSFISIFPLILLPGFIAEVIISRLLVDHFLFYN